MLDPRVRRCLEAGNSVLVGTVDAQGMPACCRAVAITCDEELKMVAVYLPIATSQQVIQNIATTHRLSVGATRMIEHFSVQLKGSADSARLARPDEAALVESRHQAFGDVIHSLGVPRRLTRSITCWPAFVVEMRVEEVYEQTPGPNAGSKIR